jgi:hypothetical protein
VQQTILDNPVSTSVALGDRCDLDSPQLASCQQALSADLEAADRAADPPPVTVWARTASDLVMAMVNSTVDLVLITQDIRDWSQAQLLLATMQLPVERNKNITIQGAALPGVYPVLDFQFIKVFIRCAVRDGAGGVQLRQQSHTAHSFLIRPLLWEIDAAVWTGCLQSTPGQAEGLQASQASVWGTICIATLHAGNGCTCGLRMMNSTSLILEQLVVKGLQVLPEPTAAALAAVQVRG